MLSAGKEKFDGRGLANIYNNLLGAADYVGELTEETAMNRDARMALFRAVDSLVSAQGEIYEALLELDRAVADTLYLDPEANPDD